MTQDRLMLSFVLLFSIIASAVTMVTSYNTVVAQLLPNQTGSPLFTTNPPLVSSNSSNVNNSSGQGSTYTNSTDGIKITVPQGWSTEEGQNDANATTLAAVYVNPPIALDPQAAVSVTIYKDTQPLSNSSVDGYLRDTIVTYRGNFPDFKITSANTGFNVSSQPAYSVTYTWTSSDSGTIKTMETGILLNGQAYYIHYNAPTPLFTKFLPQVNQIIGSLKVQPPPQ